MRRPQATTVSAANEGAGMTSNDRRGLGSGDALGIGRRQLAPQWRLVDLRRHDQAGPDADLAQKLEPARGSRGQDQRSGGSQDFGRSAI